MARSGLVRELSFALGLLEQGVNWGTRPTSVIHTVILFAVPLSEGPRYHSLVLTFASYLMDLRTSSALHRCTRPGQILSILREIRCVSTGPGAGLALK